MDSKSYDELHGMKNWDGLLDPLDHGLRSLILGYGDLCAAAERAFNNDEGHKYCGYSHYGKSSFFKGAMLPWAESKYDVVSFIYATVNIDSYVHLLFPCSPGNNVESNWMGYVAVSNDEFSKSIGRREICVVWRGTVRSYEWVTDIVGSMPVPAEPLFPPPGNGKPTATLKPTVMGGWLAIYNTSDPGSKFLKTSARTQLLGRIRELLIKYKDETVSITCTGHSLGREICVVWRGTVRSYEWVTDIVGSTPVPAEPLFPPPGNGKPTATLKPTVMGVWLAIYNTSDPGSKFLKTSARTQLLGRIRELLIKYKDETVSITCTGHSLGREICVVWRGTVRTYEWVTDIVGSTPVPAEPLFPPPGNGKPTATLKPTVMGGWLAIYNTSDPGSKFLKTSARTQLLGRIRELLIKYKDETVSITCTGHSLGGCLAVLSAVDLAANVAPPAVNVSAFIFESPQVGNEAFKSKMEELPNLKVLRIKNAPDIIPFWPSKLLKWLNEHTWNIVPSYLMQYEDVGVEILIDSSKLPYLKHVTGFHPLVFHDLERVLHTLSGWTGMNGEFDWGIMKRDLSLVNLWRGSLNEKFNIPVAWWAQKNKGMVLNDYGHWELSPVDLDDHDLPVY